MSFLYPTFLLGLLAVSIPIIIHLFNFRKPKKVLFTNVKFLRSVKETTTSKLKLKHYLILASRIGFIIFLVFAFAQPFMKGKNAALMEGNKNVLIYLDNSYSMQQEENGDNALDISIKSINKLMDLYFLNTSYNLLTNDFEGKDQFFRNAEKLRERLTEIKFSGLYRDAENISRRQDLFQHRNNTESSHVFWFSDFQKSTIGDLDKIRFDSANQYFLIPLSTNQETSNIYIDSIWLSVPLVRARENNSLEVQIMNSGKKEVRDLILKLYMNEVQVSTASIDIPAGSFGHTKFVFNINDDGEKLCRISFDDYPITFDNDHYFVINVSPRIRILHLHQDEGKYLSAVFGNESVFDLQSNRIGAFDHSMINVAGMIVLDNLKEIPYALHPVLKDYVKNGGSLFIYPAAGINADSYNKLLVQLGIPEIEVEKTDTAGGKAAMELIPPDLNHPFFSNTFEKTEYKINMPYAYPVVRWGGQGDNLLRFKTGDPFITMFKNEKGKIYLSRAPLQNAFTNFHKHAVFVPVMYKAAFNSITNSERLAYSFQDPSLSLDIDPAAGEQVYSLHGKEIEMIPAQRISGRKLLLEIPREDMKAGFYTLKIKDLPVRTIAFNYDKNESAQETYRPEELKKFEQLYKNVHIYTTDNEEDFYKGFKKENVGIALWKYCLILCLIFLLMEILFIRFL